MKFDPSEICISTVFEGILPSKILEHQLSFGGLYSKFCETLVNNGALDEPVDANRVSFSPSRSDMSRVPVPLLPIEAFRDGKVYTVWSHEPELRFLSSGTTGTVRSTHHVAYSAMYRTSIHAGLRYFYPEKKHTFLAYTPGYNENPESSLIWMLNELISSDESELSRFLEIGEPVSQSLLTEIKRAGRSVVLFGAAFGLVDLAENHPVSLPHGSLIIETGGMKTHRKEMSRSELHTILAEGFNLDYGSVHSEYGMTELLSQAYSGGDFWFRTPPWMKVYIIDPEDPLHCQPLDTEGLIGIIDLANWASCPFILTGDRGVMRSDGSFQVLGRWNSHHLRGCNFLLEVD